MGDAGGGEVGQNLREVRRERGRGEVVVRVEIHRGIFEGWFAERREGTLRGAEAGRRSLSTRSEVELLDVGLVKNEGLSE